MLVAWLLASTVSQLVAQRLEDDALARVGTLLPSLVARRPWHAYRVVTHAFVPNTSLVATPGAPWTGLADPVFAIGATWALGPTLEAFFGGRRFLAFVVLAAALSGLVALGYGLLHPSFRAQPAHGVGTLGFALVVAFAAQLPKARFAWSSRLSVGARPFAAVVVTLGLSSVLLASQQASPAAPIGAVLLAGWLSSTLAPRWSGAAEAVVGGRS